MPDQHAAATEHELISTIAEPLGALPEDPLAVVAIEFPIALRGYDRFAVDAYVERTTQLVAELQSTRSPEIAVRRALERVGEEISGILQRAHETADEITARSRAEADARLEAARAEAIELTAAATRQVKDLDAETERIWAERHSIVTDARELARRLSALAEDALARFPADPAAAGGQEALDRPAPQAPVAAHLFDGASAGEAITEPPAEDPPTAEHATAEQPAPEFEHPGAQGRAAQETITDLPTVGMPLIEPWEGEPPAEPWDFGGPPFNPDEV